MESTRLTAELMALNKVYSLDISPFFLERPKVYLVGKNKNCDGNAAELLRTQLQQRLLEQHNNEPLYSGALSLDVSFFMAASSATSKTEAGKRLGQYHGQKPNIENLLNQIIKCCSVLWHEASQIAHLSATKLYCPDDNPRIEIIIKSLG